MTTPRTITRESEAWFLLAKQYDARARTNSALCVELMPETYGLRRYTSIERRVALPLRKAMVARIRDDLKTVGRAYSWGNYPEGVSIDEERRYRVLACLMFGHEAASEGR